MNVLIDYHHGELYESLLKLFEDRLSCKVYRPIGKDWFNEDFWKISNNEAVVEQYLGIFDFLIKKENGIYIDTWYRGFKNNKENERLHNCITLNAAKEMKWDIIVSTINEQFHPMGIFIKKYCPSAKHILQVGNMCYPINPIAKNVLNSTTSVCTAPNYIEYNQEFDLTPFIYKKPNDIKTISSFLHYNSNHKGYRFFELEKEMKDWTFKEYGVDGREGCSKNYYEQCDQYLNSGFVWHVKLVGDGYGYNLYKSLAAGRPLVLNYSHFYKNNHKMFNKNYFDINRVVIDYQNYFSPIESIFDNKSNYQIKTELECKYETWNEDSLYIYNRFRELVNFDYEFDQIKLFIENLI